MTPDLFLKIFSTIFGLLIGSFLNVVIIRLPQNKSVVTPRSSCPKCGHMIKWYENLPVISWIFLKGKCSKCQVKIPFRYPLIEILCGFFAFFLAPTQFEFSAFTYSIFYFSIACIFLAHFVIDIEHQLLPDKINIYFLLITLPYVILNYPIQHWLLGGVIGFFGPFGITYLFYKIKGQVGLGGGDIKLFGILGLLLGPIGVLNNIFISCMVGAVLGIALIVTKKLDRNAPMPFGPFIILAATIQIFFPSLADKIAPVILQ